MEMVLFIGLPASGKSSFYQNQFFSTHTRVNLDLLKTRVREKALVISCIKAQQSFVVDNTNATREDRARYISLVQAAGFKITGYYFTSSLKEALKRNCQRPDMDRIPDVAIFSIAQKFVVPRKDEGFDRLWSVTLNDIRSFTVSEL